ncbi:hypothetical protein ACJJTC_019684 [Scirpophaga incertulas]
MLDEKIEKGRDYDSSSESGSANRTRASKSLNREMALDITVDTIIAISAQPADAGTAASITAGATAAGTPRAARAPHGRCCRQQHVPDGMSPPPPRRAHSAQAPPTRPDPRQINGDNWHDPHKNPPSKRPHSAGSNWKKQSKSSALQPETKEERG